MLYLRGRTVSVIFCVVSMLAYGSAFSQTLVRFDTGFTVECRDVTPPERRKLYPASRVIEVIIRVSPNIVAGSERELHELYFEMICPDRVARVLSFVPNSELTSDVVDGTIAVRIARGVGEGQLRYAVSPKAGAARAGAAYEVTEVKFELLAPKHVLVASGTLEREHGAFFKLRRSTQGTLEKAREFALLMEVPAGWRGGNFTVRCIAQGATRWPWRDHPIVGQATFAVGFYKQGDQEAKELANELAEKQQDLFDTIGRDAAEAATTEDGWVRVISRWFLTRWLRDQTPPSWPFRDSPGGALAGLPIHHLLSTGTVPANITGPALAEAVAAYRNRAAAELPSTLAEAQDEFEAAKAALRALNN